MALNNILTVSPAGDAVVALKHTYIGDSGHWHQMLIELDLVRHHTPGTHCQQKMANHCLTVHHRFPYIYLPSQ